MADGVVSEIEMAEIGEEREMLITRESVEIAQEIRGSQFQLF